MGTCSDSGVTIPCGLGDGLPRFLNLTAGYLPKLEVLPPTDSSLRRNSLDRYLIMLFSTPEIPTYRQKQVAGK